MSGLLCWWRGCKQAGSDRVGFDRVGSHVQVDHWGGDDDVNRSFVCQQNSVAHIYTRKIAQDTIIHIRYHNLGRAPLIFRPYGAVFSIAVTKGQWNWWVDWVSVGELSSVNFISSTASTAYSTCVCLDVLSNFFQIATPTVFLWFSQNLAADKAICQKTMEQSFKILNFKLQFFLNYRVPFSCITIWAEMPHWYWYLSCGFYVGLNLILMKLGINDVTVTATVLQSGIWIFA